MGTPTASIEQLARRLPFQVDDSEAVNSLFVRVLDSSRPADIELLEVWTYCFVWRYFLWKHIQKETGTASEFEGMVSEAYRRVSLGRDRLSRTSRYASWVSVVCRNTFINAARKIRTEVLLDDRGIEMLESDVPVREHDPALLRRALEEAVERLPAHLVGSARLYFLERFDYEEMEAITGKSAATLRSYVHKSMKRLRADSWLCEFREYLNDEFFDE